MMPFGIWIEDWGERFFLSFFKVTSIHEKILFSYFFTIVCYCRKLTENQTCNLISWKVCLENYDNRIFWLNKRGFGVSSFHRSFYKGRGFKISDEIAFRGVKTIQMSEKGCKSVICENLKLIAWNVDAL